MSRPEVGEDYIFLCENIRFPSSCSVFQKHALCTVYNERERGTNMHGVGNLIGIVGNTGT